MQFVVILVTFVVVLSVIAVVVIFVVVDEQLAAVSVRSVDQHFTLIRH